HACWRQLGLCRLRFGTSRLAHDSMRRNSPAEKIDVLVSVRKTDKLLMSVPAARRPRARASTSVVPPPIKGSKTRSPGFENESTISRAKDGEKRAGYL